MSTPENRIAQANAAALEARLAIAEEITQVLQVAMGLTREERYDYVKTLADAHAQMWIVNLP